VIKLFMYKFILNFKNSINGIKEALKEYYLCVNNNFIKKT